MWESSRMMLPEHKEKSIVLQKEDNKIIKPELTEEEQQMLFGRLKASKSNTVEVSITVFGENDNKNISGIVTGLDKYLVKIETVGGWRIFNFTDVIGVEFSTDSY